MFYNVYMSDLNIKQIQNIMDWSYPTALTFAKINGERRSNNPRDKWLVPADIVYNLIVNEQQQANEKMVKFKNVGVGLNGESG